MSESKKILSTVQKLTELLDKKEAGKFYTKQYLLQRFASVLNEASSDYFIMNLESIVKSSSKNVLSQKELTELHDSLYNSCHGTQSAFAEFLSDLVFQKEAKKVAYANAEYLLDHREELEIAPQKELKESIEKAFTLSKSSGMLPYMGTDTYEKAAIKKLSSLGFAPLSTRCEKDFGSHILVVSSVRDARQREVLIKMPVKVAAITNADMFIDGDKVQELNRSNLETYIRIKADLKDLSSRENYGALFVEQLLAEAPKSEIPSDALPYLDLDAKILASQFYSLNQVSAASNIVKSELGSIVRAGDVRVHDADASHLKLSAKIIVGYGTEEIFVPVKFANNKPLIPSKFVSASGSEYDFSMSGIREFLSKKEATEVSHAFARVPQEYTKSSYASLLTEVLDGVSSKDYKKSEDALYAIASVYGEDKRNEAIGQYFAAVKLGAADKRTEFVKSAQKRKELISTPNSSELYSPRLGLVLSKIEFDKDGEMYPVGRLPRNIADDETIAISSYKIAIS